MKRTNPLVSVIIPTHQRRGSLLRALDALSRQELESDSFEVIVSVDGSTDGTREAVESFTAPFTLRCVHGAKRGRATACNAGIELAAGEVVVILDDDMEPAPACLVSHLRDHPAGSRTCVMGAVPVHVDPTTGRAARYVAAKFNSHLATLAQPDHAFALRDFYSGNASIRRDVLLEVGLFEEAFTLYGNEDLELSMRLRAGGVDLRYDPDALARQHYDKRLNELAQDTLDKGKTAVLLASTRPDAFEGLQLAQYRTQFGKWRAVRRLLLAATRRQPATIGLVLRSARLLERVGAWRLPFFYVLVLDYFYWAGAAAALRDVEPEGRLALLADELQHGPIGLPLHR
jgi:glycosyltransferase involved in cell wall biosynthesis